MYATVQLYEPHQGLLLPYPTAGALSVWTPVNCINCNGVLRFSPYPSATYRETNRQLCYVDVPF